MSGGFDDYEVVADDPLEESDDDAARGVSPFPNPDISECPVVPLGFLGGKVVFAMPEGEIRFELAAKVGSMLRTDIFACAAGMRFLTYWRGREDKFLRDLCAIWFVRQCRMAKLWDAGRTVRSLGLWPGEDGQVVLHLGDEIWRLAKGKRADVLSIIDALRERAGPLYRLRPPAPRPGKPASAADGLWARETLDLWRFEPIGREGLTGADVVAGWAMASLLGAVAPFRGHLLVNAMAGSGKTTLMYFIQGLLGALAGEVIDSFTEAGLRNDLAGMARPVLLDEAEGAPGTNGPGVVEKVLELLRRMATGSGGNRKQGDVGGGSVTQTAVGAVAMAAINPPKLGAADASRMVEVRIHPLGGSGNVSRGELTAAVEKARGLGPALLGRALKGVWRYRADVEEMSAALSRAGQDPRTGDLVAMLAAGRRLLLFDAPLSPEAADAEAAFWSPLLAQRESAEIVANPGADALAHLMAADAGLHISNRRETLGGLIHRWARREREYDDVLAQHGLRISDAPAPDGREGPWLLVANHHPKLAAIFRPTEWSDWRRTLGYLDDLGAEHVTWCTPNSIRFGVGVKQRAIAIPLTPWLEGAPLRPAPMARGVQPLPRSSAVPAAVPEEDLDWPDETA